MIHIQQGQAQLDELKHGIIGLFKIHGSNQFKLVVDVNNNVTIDIIRFTQFGNIQEEFNLPTDYGTLKLFPDNRNMIEMLDSPFEWNAFIKSFSPENNTTKIINKQ
jgi:hypothetical protein